MNATALIKTAGTLVADGKGLLAMDESNATRNKRLPRRAFLKPRRLAAPIGN